MKAKGRHLPTLLTSYFLLLTLEFTGFPLARQRTTMRIAAQGPTVRFTYYGYARGAVKRDEGGGVVKGNFGAAMERGAIQSRADEGGQGTASFPSADPPTREAADPNSLERKEGATHDGLSR